jgi:hypothetical protein
MAIISSVKNPLKPRAIGIFPPLSSCEEGFQGNWGKTTMYTTLRAHHYTALATSR